MQPHLPPPIFLAPQAAPIILKSFSIIEYLYKDINSGLAKTLSSNLANNFRFRAIGNDKEIEFDKKQLIKIKH